MKNNNHRRDTSQKLDTIQERLLKLFEYTEEAEVFLSQVRRLKARYARDQFSLIEKTLNEHGLPVIEKALNYCMTHSLYSAVEFRNAATYFEDRAELELEEISKYPNVTVLKTAAAISKKRALSEYARATKGGEF